MNYRVIDQRLANSGHFVDDGLDKLAKDGLQVVIDLRPDPPQDLKQRVTTRGIEYIQVPVSWRKPKVSDFDAFRKVLQRERHRRVLVQCAANYRASALTYLYRTLVEQVPEAQAAEAMHSVWVPEGKWARYIERVRNEFKPAQPDAL